MIDKKKLWIFVVMIFLASGIVGAQLENELDIKGTNTKIKQIDSAIGAAEAKLGAPVTGEEGEREAKGGKWGYIGLGVAALGLGGGGIAYVRSRKFRGVVNRWARRIGGGLLDSIIIKLLLTILGMQANKINNQRKIEDMEGMINRASKVNISGDDAEDDLNKLNNEVEDLRRRIQNARRT